MLLRIKQQGLDITPQILIVSILKFYEILELLIFVMLCHEPDFCSVLNLSVVPRLPVSSQMQ